MFSGIVQQFVVVTCSLGILIGGAARIVRAASESPVSSGDQAASAQAGDAKMRLRFAATEKPPVQPAKGMQVFSYAKAGNIFFSADGDTLYVQRFPGFGGNRAPDNAPKTPLDYSLSVWSVPDKKKVKDIAGSQTAALSPSGKTIGVAGMFKNKRLVRLIDAKSGEVKQEVEIKKVAVPGIANSGMAFAMPLSGPVVFDIDGKRLFIRVPDGPFNLVSWDFKANKLTRWPNAPWYRLDIRGVSADGKWLLGLDVSRNFRPTGMVEGDPAILVYDLATGKRVRDFCQTPGARCVVAADGNTVATFGNKKAASLELWNVSTGQRSAVCDTKIAVELVELKELMELRARGLAINNGFGGIFDATFSADGRFVASCLGTADIGYVHVFDAQTGRVIASEKLAYCPQAIAFSRDGNSLAVAGGIGPFNLSVWDISGFNSPGAKQGP